MLVAGQKFTVKDTFDRFITVPDCFVWRTNKIGTGNGEAKLYVSDKTTMYGFFNNGTSFKNIPCFLLREDLLKYLTATKPEYINPSQPYRDQNELPQLWQERWNKVNNLPEVIHFTINDQNQIGGPRGYIKSTDGAYKLIRELSLPLITYISAMAVSDGTQSNLYYFKLFVDFDAVTKLKNGPLVFRYGENKQSHVDNVSHESDRTNVVAQQRVREGQQLYREKLLEECPFCPITGITDDRLLIASHIKPWAVSDNKERVDPKNGFMLSPLYDKLFDRGLMTFTDDREVLISNWINPRNISKLGIENGQFLQRLPIDDERMVYLAYHRDFVFCG